MDILRKLVFSAALPVLLSAACTFGAAPPTEPQQPGEPSPATAPPVPASPSAPQVAETASVSLPSLPAPELPQILLTVDAVPSGGRIAPLLGVGGGPLPPDRGDGAVLTEEYQSVGVTMIRTHDMGGPLDMAIIYPDQNADPRDPASYDSEASDQVFAAILEGGFEPYLRLGDSMHTSPGMPTLATRAPINPDNWVQAAVEVVRHYDEISPALASQGGALNDRLEQYTSRFLDYLQKHNTPLDFFSWHVYTSDAETYKQLAEFYRAQLDTHGYTAAESHITEWNTAMRGEDETDAVRNTARGAALMSAGWIGLQEGGVEVSTFYRGNEHTNRGNMGLFTPEGDPKPMAWAFSLWAQMTAHPDRLNISPESEQVNPLWALAGRNADGAIALLIVNPTDTPTSWQAVFAGRETPASATLYQVSDTAEGVQAFIPEAPAAEIEDYTVQLLIVRP
ncbi:MAG TPA: hypothetical protein G4O05_04470 [Caldilineae bacterium]|nr:hypothetical protein [Caldilineae bacterium]